MINVEEHLKLASVAASRIYKTTTIRYRFEYDDVYQQCCLELVRCSDKFNESKGTFSTYAIRCMELACYRMMRDDRYHPQHRTNKETWGNSFASLDYKIGEDEKVDAYNNTPIIDDYSSIYVKDFLDTLTDFEKDIMILYLSGYSIADIAKIKNKLYNVIRVAIKRIGLKHNGTYHDKRTDRKNKFSAELMERNKKILELYKSGYRQKDIAEMFNISASSVRQALVKIRRIESIEAS